MRETQLLGPLYAYPREGIHAPPHPRCLPSVGPPPKERACAPSRLCYKSAEEQRADAFSFIERSSTLTRPKTTMTRSRVDDQTPKGVQPTPTPQRPYRLLRSDRSAARCAAELPRANFDPLAPRRNQKDRAPLEFFIHRHFHRAFHRKLAWAPAQLARTSMLWKGPSRPAKSRGVLMNTSEVGEVGEVGAALATLNRRRGRGATWRIDPGLQP